MRKATQRIREDHRRARLAAKARRRHCFGHFGISGKFCRDHAQPQQFTRPLCIAGGNADHRREGPKYVAKPFGDGPVESKPVADDSHEQIENAQRAEHGDQKGSDAHEQFHARHRAGDKRRHRALFFGQVEFRILAHGNGLAVFGAEQFAHNDRGGGAHQRRGEQVACDGGEDVFEPVYIDAEDGRCDGGHSCGEDHAQFAAGHGGQIGADRGRGFDADEEITRGAEALSPADPHESPKEPTKGPDEFGHDAQVVEQAHGGGVEDDHGQAMDDEHEAMCVVGIREGPEEEILACLGSADEFHDRVIDPEHHAARAGRTKHHRRDGNLQGHARENRSAINVAPVGRKDPSDGH